MTAKNDSRWIAGFWRRVVALFVDAVLLGLLGMLLGVMLEKTFVIMGGWGRVVGFSIAFAYFGIMNSKIANGQTLGKKIMGLRVVDAANQAIALPRSLARYVMLGVPVFLNGAQLSNDIILSWVAYPVVFIVFGGLSSIAYLYVFNRHTRQSLHDLVTGTYVVNADAKAGVASAVWKPHFAIVALLLSLSLLIPPLTSHLMESPAFKGLVNAQSAVMASPAVIYATVNDSSTSFTSEKGVKASSAVEVQAFLRSNTVGDEKLARQLAAAVVASHPASLDRNVVSIDLRYGYDIGIWSMWVNHVHAFAPHELITQ